MSAPAIVARASADGISNALEVQPATVTTMPTPAAAWIAENGSDAGVRARTAVPNTAAIRIAASSEALASRTTASPGPISTGVSQTSRACPVSGCTRKRTGCAERTCARISASPRSGLVSAPSTTPSICSVNSSGHAAWNAAVSAIVPLGYIGHGTE